MNQAEKKSRLIKRVLVKRLFDTYSYDLIVPHTNLYENENLFLLYGDNGSGKTTILNLIFHLLNPEPYGGHRSYLGSVAFESFEIILEGDIRILAYREKPDIIGKYSIKVFDGPQTEILKWNWHPKKTHKDELSIPFEEIYSNFCNILANLKISFHLLRDTRRIETSIKKDRRYVRTIHSDFDVEEVLLKTHRLDKDVHSPDELLKQSIDLAIDWFQKKALSGTNVGYTSVNSIYNDIIKRIVTDDNNELDNIAKNTLDLKEKLISLRNRDEQFSKFGLTPEMQIDDILSSLDKAASQHMEILKTVLSPYLNGHNARLDALQELQNVMNNFVTLLNDFYTNKNISVHLKEGLQIKTNKGSDIPPFGLSSGERQLLLLFCQAISARNEGIIFVIDEPEISLNIKWQRKFIPALLTCLKGTDSQIILATHSIEILSQYRQYVIPLENLESDC